jgi:hypothetical protein
MTTGERGTKERQEAGEGEGKRNKAKNKQEG